MVAIRDVAREAGFSTATVSRVLEGGTYPVREETRRRVLDAAERLHYQPNGLARNLRTGRNNTVGVCAGVLNPTALSALDGILDRCHAAGRQVHIAISAWDPEQERRHLDRFYQERADGVLSYPVGASVDGYRRLQAAGIPVVLLHRKVPGLRAPMVRHDFASGYTQAVAYLVQRGHRHIAVMLPGGPVGRDQHARAWRNALTNAGLDVEPELMRYAALDTPHGAGPAPAMDLLSRSNRPTAIVAVEFADTLLAIRLAHEAGLTIGHDLDVVGGGDPRWGFLVTPPMPLLRVDAFRLGTVATDLLQARIAEPHATPRAPEVVIPIELVHPEHQEAQRV